MAKKSDFDDAVKLPAGLDSAAIRRAIDYIEKGLAELIDVYHEQANLFSALVGVYGTKALDAISSYEKHRNLDTAQQRFPDLKRRGSGSNPSPQDSLESKGSKRPWALQSHYDHAGWYHAYPVATYKPISPYRMDTTSMTLVRSTAMIATPRLTSARRSSSMPSRERPARSFTGGWNVYLRRDRESGGTHRRFHVRDSCRSAVGSTFWRRGVISFVVRTRCDLCGIIEGVHAR